MLPGCSATSLERSRNFPTKSLTCQADLSSMRYSCELLLTTIKTIATQQNSPSKGDKFSQIILYAEQTNKNNIVEFIWVPLHLTSAKQKLYRI